MKKCLAIMVLILLVALSFTIDQYRRTASKLDVTMGNVKAYDNILGESRKQSAALQLTIDQLKSYKDSVLVELDKTRKELGIKDKRLKALQAISSSFSKTDTVILKDTIFKNPSFALDTLLRDEWYSTKISLRYPSMIAVDPSFRSEKYVVVSSKRETVNPPKKFFLLRWLQRRHTVLNVDVVEKNPYAHDQGSRYIEIIK